MNQPHGVVAPSPATDSSRPGALKVARVLSLVAAAAGIIAGIAAFTNGKEAIKRFVADTIGGSTDSELVQSLMNEEIESAYGLLVTKASVAVSSAVLVAVLALVVAGGKRAVRILLSVFLIGNVLTSGLLAAETEVLPDLTLIGAFLGVILSLAAVPLLFTRSVRRFGSRDTA